MKKRAKCAVHGCQPATRQFSKKIIESLERKISFRYDGKMPRYLGIDYLTDVSFLLCFSSKKLILIKIKLFLSDLR